MQLLNKARPILFKKHKYSKKKSRRCIILFQYKEKLWSKDWGGGTHTGERILPVSLQQNCWKDRPFLETNSCLSLQQQELFRCGSFLWRTPEGQCTWMHLLPGWCLLVKIIATQITLMTWNVSTSVAYLALVPLGAIPSNTTPWPGSNCGDILCQCNSFQLHTTLRMKS